MSAPRCVVIGAGRLAGGFVAPLLHQAGWQVVLVSRSQAIVASINDGCGLWLRRVGDPPEDHWIGSVTALMYDAPEVANVIAAADLVATSVGPSALAEVGRFLAGPLRGRLECSTRPINVITFENHRRAPELLAVGLIEADSQLAAMIGRRLGIAGAAAWRTVSHRSVTNAGLRFDANRVDECYVDVASLVPGAAPLDSSVAGLDLVEPFDYWMTEKLWVFNGGHATAAYLGWLLECPTVDAALARPEVYNTVRTVVEEAQCAVGSLLIGQPGPAPGLARSVESVLEWYADPALADPVIRIAREPRRKLAADDRLIGPAMNCLATGRRPVGLANAAAAALCYAETSDRQATDLQHELALVGPAEVLATVGMLDPGDELSRLICQRYGEHRAEKMKL